MCTIIYKKKLLQIFTFVYYGYKLNYLCPPCFCHNSLIYILIYWFISISVTLYLYIYIIYQLCCFKRTNIILDPCRGINTIIYVVYFGEMYIRLWKVNSQHLWAMKGKIRSWRTYRITFTRRQVRRLGNVLKKNKQSWDIMAVVLNSS